MFCFHMYVNSAQYPLTGWWASTAWMLVSLIFLVLCSRFYRCYQLLICLAFLMVQWWVWFPIRTDGWSIVSACIRWISYCQRPLFKRTCAGAIYWETHSLYSFLFVVADDIGSFLLESLFEVCKYRHACTCILSHQKQGNWQFLGEFYVSFGAVTDRHV